MSKTARDFLIAVAASVAAGIVVDLIRRRMTRASLTVINGGAHAAANET